MLVAAERVDKVAAGAGSPVGLWPSDVDVDPQDLPSS